jgi:hypothetical protein
MLFVELPAKRDPLSSPVVIHFWYTLPNVASYIGNRPRGSYQERQNREAGVIRTTLKSLNRV